MDIIPFSIPENTLPNPPPTPINQKKVAIFFWWLDPETENSILPDEIRPYLSKKGTLVCLEIEPFPSTFQLHDGRGKLFVYWGEESATINLKRIFTVLGIPENSCMGLFYTLHTLTGHLTPILGMQFPPVIIPDLMDYCVRSLRRVAAKGGMPPWKAGEKNLDELLDALESDPAASATACRQLLNDIAGYMDSICFSFYRGMHIPTEERALLERSVLPAPEPPASPALPPAPAPEAAATIPAPSVSLPSTVPEPTDSEWKAWLLVVHRGMKQKQVAPLLNKHKAKGKTGQPVRWTQGMVSAAVKTVERYLATIPINLRDTVAKAQHARLCSTDPHTMAVNTPSRDEEYNGDNE